jgi:hypothetical protein
MTAKRRNRESSCKKFSFQQEQLCNIFPYAGIIVLKRKVCTTIVGSKASEVSEDLKFSGIS